MLSVSTNWISRSVLTGDEIIAAVEAVGLSSIELAYSLTHRQAEELQRAIHASPPLIRVSSVHAPCPADPMSSPSPEGYILSDTSDSGRRKAVDALIKTAHFAAEMGAKVVVSHGGHISAIRSTMQNLTELLEAGKRHTDEYSKRLEKMFSQRDDKARKPFKALIESLDDVLPTFERLDLTLAIENMPSFHALPSEAEMQLLLERYPSKHFGYWHDLGHADIRERYGVIHHLPLLKRFLPRLKGVHLHYSPLLVDTHQMPTAAGNTATLDFGKYKFLKDANIPLVLEPSSSVPLEAVAGAVKYLTEIWA